MLEGRSYRYKRSLIEKRKRGYLERTSALGLWERFLTAITQVIVAAPLEKQPVKSRKKL